jgi:single-strand DNA-binding protein
MNSCNFAGVVARPELRYTANGNGIFKCGLGIRTSEKDETGKNKTLWVNITAFGKQAELLNSLAKKGAIISVTAAFGLNEWTDKEGGKHKDANFVVRDFSILKFSDQEQTDQPVQEAAATEEDAPF